MRFFLLVFAVFIVGGLLAGGLAVRILWNLAPSTAVVGTTGGGSSSSAAGISPETGTPVSRIVSPLTQPEPQPTPQGNAPAATSVPSVPWSLLYVVDGDMWLTGQGQSTQLTQDGEIGQPAFTDGIVAWVEHAKDGSDIWAVGDNMAAHRVTHDLSSVIPQNVWAGQPVFLPGTQRAYVLSDYNKDTTGVGDLAVWELDLQRGTLMQITHPPSYTGGDQDVTVNTANPKQIVFTRYVYAGTDMVESLNWLDISEGTAVPLTDQNHPSRQASFSPDGTRLAFVQATGPDEDLYVANLDITNGQPTLANVQQVATGMVAEPTWSPDGGTLGYMNLSGDEFQIWAVSVQQGSGGTQAIGQPRQVTAGTGVDATSRPVWLTSDQANAVHQWFASDNQFTTNGS